MQYSKLENQSLESDIRESTPASTEKSVYFGIRNAILSKPISWKIGAIVGCIGLVIISLLVLTEYLILPKSATKSDKNPAPIASKLSAQPINCFEKGSQGADECIQYFDGWITIQRRDKYDISFNMSYSDYENGFGNPLLGDFWIGLSKMHELTNNGSNWIMRTEFDTWNDRSHYWIEYSDFKIADKGEKYKLTIGERIAGSFEDYPERGWQYQNGMMFTTYDSDNDLNVVENCALQWSGGWWYNKCYSVNLNALPARGPHNTYHYMSYSMPEFGWKQLRNSLMKIRIS